ncbi:MAG: hypothetical protein QM779_02925 [Propionicimonas sp.]|uniref:hypothetical protein n=1 Tax=Propionicimonas sp. TaxID=1955623 RepID=UPI003D150DF6
MTDSTWEQPGFEDSLEATAVNLITNFVQEIFADLDPLELVRAGAPELSAEDQRTVAHLIDEAVVEIEVDFSGHEH